MVTGRLSDVLGKMKNHPLFSHLDHQWQTHVFTGIRESHYPPETQIIQQGQTAAYFYFILFYRVE